MRVRIIEPNVGDKQKKKVCAYARVSTATYKQGESLENQIIYYENFITSNPEYEYVGVFADRGITGTTDNRPEFQRMLDLCKEGKIDLIITKSISRFARNTTIMLKVVRELKELGVEVRFEKENINTLSGDAKLQKTYTPNYRDKKKKVNKGELNSYYVEDSHPAIISKEIWAKVQIEMEKRAKVKGNTKGSKKYQKRYPLSGMLYCSKCGSILRRRTCNSKLKCKKIVWQCSNYIKNGKSACEGTVIEDEVISGLNIKEETIIKEEIKNGEKHYSYTSKEIS